MSRAHGLTGSGRIALAMTLALLSLGVGGCGERSVEAIRFGLAGAPNTLDPRFATDATSMRINRLVYRALVGFDARDRPAPALAEWERLTPTHYRFHLRDSGRRFHDGSRLTAGDVEATYASVLAPDAASPHRAMLSVIDRMNVRDPDTIDFHLERPDVMFPGYLTIGILPEALIEQGHDFGRVPVGSGPFAFQRWPEEGRLRLERRRDGQAFEFLRVNEATVRVLKLLRGEIDMLQNDLPPELVHFIEGREGVRVRYHEGTNFNYVGFNLRDRLAGEPAVRRAVAHAIDRDAIVAHMMGRLARPAHALLPPGHWAGHPGLEGYAHDPERARALLREAGYGPGRPARITYKTSNDPFRLRLATVLQRQLEEVGFEVDLRSYDWGTFYGDIKAGRFQMYSLQWVGIKLPDIFRHAFHSDFRPPRGANRGHYVSEHADRLIEAARAAQDLETRARHYRELQALLLEDLPYVPLWYENHVYATRTAFEGYEMARDGNYDGLLHVRRVE